MSQKLTKNHSVLLVKERTENVSKLLNQHVLLPVVTCSQHPEKSVEFFCTDCSVLVCVQCALIQHRGHEFEELNKLSEKKRVEMKESVQTMPDSIAKLEEILVKGTTVRENIKPSKAAVDDEIRKAFKEMKEELDKREKVLLAKSSEISTAKETSLAIQLEELTSLKDQMVACTAVMSEVQESYNDTELLSVVTTLQTRVQELTQKFDKTPLELMEDEVLLLILDADSLQNGITELGSVTKKQPTKPRDYTSIVDPVMTIPTNTPDSIAIHHSGDIFVTNYSEHKIEVFDKKGNKKSSIGSKGLSDGQFTNPTGIAITGDVIFVTENAGSRVQKLTTGGEFLYQFGLQSTVQFKSLWGCSVSSNGVLCVADQSSKLVLAFSSDGSHSHTINCSPQKPKFVSFDASGNIYVGLDGIHIFDQAGKFVRSFGKGTVPNLDGIAVDQHGYCIVGGKKNVYIFDPQDKLIHTIHHQDNVTGIALDQNGFVYVSEYSSNKIFKY